MTNRELAKALRLCGGTRTVEECQNGCPFFRGPDAELCVPGMTAACADALENHETHVAVLQREIEWLRKKVPQWISVEERMPENEEWVLCHCTDGKMRVLSYDHIMDDWDFTVINGHGYYYPRDVVTHWMPIPEPPSTEGVE